MKSCTKSNSKICILLLFAVVVIAAIFNYPLKKEVTNEELSNSIAVYVETKPFKKEYEIENFVPLL